VRNYRFLIPILTHINNTSIWSLIELADPYTVPLSAINHLSHLTMMSNGHWAGTADLKIFESAHQFRIESERPIQIWISKLCRSLVKLSLMTNVTPVELRQQDICLTEFRRLLKTVLFRWDSAHCDFFVLIAPCISTLTYLLTLLIQFTNKMYKSTQYSLQTKCTKVHNINHKYCLVQGSYRYLKFKSQFSRSFPRENEPFFQEFLTNCM